MDRRFLIVFFTFCQLTIVLPAHALTIYMTPEEALKLFFAQSDRISSETKFVLPDEQKNIEKKLGYKLKKNKWIFFVATTGKKIDGYALLDNEIGKMEPITFMTALTDQGKVKGVEVLVYRESHGTEVQSKRFTKQYLGKDKDSSIMVGRDIKHISGATISSRSLSNGVKRALILWNHFYGSQ